MHAFPSSICTACCPKIIICPQNSPFPPMQSVTPKTIFTPKTICRTPHREYSHGWCYKMCRPAQVTWPNHSPSLSRNPNTFSSMFRKLDIFRWIFAQYFYCDLHPDDITLLAAWMMLLFLHRRHFSEVGGLDKDLISVCSSKLLSWTGIILEY